MKKPSLLDRLTGMAGNDTDYDDFFEDDQPIDSYEHDSQPRLNEENNPQTAAMHPADSKPANNWDQTFDSAEGQLSVDVYQTAEYVVVKALVAGVLPNNLEISVSREMLTIEGTREDEHEVETEDYFQRELYWGSFSRTILLPAEVDVDMAEAVEKHGILVIRLPKINKSKQTKLKVRTK